LLTELQNLTGFIVDFDCNNFHCNCLVNFSDVRIIDWIAEGTMLTVAIYSIFEGVKIATYHVNTMSDITLNSKLLVVI